MTNQTQPAVTPSSVSDAGDRPLIWIGEGSKGEMKPKSQAAVSVFDHGLLYGDGIFEGIRVYRGRIFKARQHMDRLYGCAEKIKLSIPISKDEMLEINRRCVEANELTEGYIRLVVTRGVGTLGLNPYMCPEPGIICIADQIRLYPKELYETGMTVVLAERPRVPVACLDPRIKSLNYLNNILAKTEALDRGLFEAIMLNTDGYVSECTGDNIFVVKNGELFTPPSDAGILEGITRRFVINELAPAAGIKVTESNMRFSALLEADEIFLTGSAAEIIAVTGIIAKDPAGNDAEHVIGMDKNVKAEGPITKKLRDAFRAIVTSDDVPED